MLRWSLTVLSLLVVLAALGLLTVPPEVGGAVADTHGDGFEDGETVFVIELDDSGDAHWRVTEHIDLTDEADEVAFAEVADEFEAGEFDLESVAAIEAAAGAVNESTGRSMTVTGHDRTSAIEGENRTGTLTVSFTWENFARMDGDDDERLHIDDVLETEQGLWLPGLTADQTLVVRSPEGYAVLDAAVPPQNGSLYWEGPTEFDRETLSATFVGNGNDTDGGPTDDTTDDTDDTDDTTDDDGAGLIGPLLVGGAVVVVVAAVLAFYRERLGDLLDSDSPTAAEDESATDGGSAEPDAVAGGTAGSVGGAGTTAGDESSAAGIAADEPDDGIDEELLSDEERVERLLEQNGGRMKQADIVDETGWSNAKVSQLLSSMADENRIDKLRIGRENLISFPDVDVTDSDGDS